MKSIKELVMKETKIVFIHTPSRDIALDLRKYCQFW